MPIDIPLNHLIHEIIAVNPFFFYCLNMVFHNQWTSIHTQFCQWILLQVTFGEGRARLRHNRHWSARVGTTSKVPKSEALRCPQRGQQWQVTDKGVQNGPKGSPHGTKTFMRNELRNEGTWRGTFTILYPVLPLNLHPLSLDASVGVGDYIADWQ